MSDGEILTLKNDLKESQEKLCQVRHETIDQRLEKIESKLDKMLWWVIGVLIAALSEIVILLLKQGV